MYNNFFTQALGESKTPFAYQVALAEKEWPDALVAPTGFGKTAAVILGWAWKNASRQKVPRRLIYCLPMRTLVDQTEQNAKIWIEQLCKANKSWRSNLPDPDKDIHVLMGGSTDSKWYELPERKAILIGTQDMLLSRALMRGYAMSRYRWPVDFALLHNDTQWVFDEVQLMGSGLATSTQLEGFRNKWGNCLPSGSMWISATLEPSWLHTVDFQRIPEVWQCPEQFSEDKKSARVRKLLNAPKPLEKLEIAPVSAVKSDLLAYVKAIANEAISLHRANQMTLVIVNTVERAQGVYNELVKCHKGEEHHLALIHSRFRPADRRLQMEKLPQPGQQKNLIVVSTQAIEAGIDMSASVLLTEVAPISSLVQRFGRVNRYGELNSKGGGLIRWIDLVGAAEDKKGKEKLSAPYTLEEVERGREYIGSKNDACPSQLHQPLSTDHSHQSVIRSKDMLDLFDTDPDLTGFDVDVSPFIRESMDTDIRVFWRDLNSKDKQENPEPLPTREELCTIPIGRAKSWLNNVKRKDKDSVFQLNPRAGSETDTSPWTRLTEEPWPGMVLMIKSSVGGYSSTTGFDPQQNKSVESIEISAKINPAADELYHFDSDSRKSVFVSLEDHLQHVANEAELLCDELEIVNGFRNQIIQASAWHDLGKAHKEFQSRMKSTNEAEHPRPDKILAKALAYAPDKNSSQKYFRHELASALAYLSHHNWTREADLIAYLIAAHHGKVRMNIQSLPSERSTQSRIARGVIEGDELPAFDLPSGESWKRDKLTLTIMELGEHPETGASWTERTQKLLGDYGPFQLAWLEALVRISDWRASKKEETGEYETK